MNKIKQYIKDNHSKIAFWVFAITSIGLMIFSAIMPPVGVIDSSVIMAVGELFAFASLAVIPSAIKEGRSVKLTKGDVSIEVNKEEEKV